MMCESYPDCGHKFGECADALAEERESEMAIYVIHETMRIPQPDNRIEDEDDMSEAA